MRSFYDMKYQTLFETVKEAIEKVKMPLILDYEWWFDRYNEIRYYVVRIRILESERNVWGNNPEWKGGAYRKTLHTIFIS